MTSLRVRLTEIIKNYPDIFREELGCCNKFQANITLKTTAKPKFSKPYHLPFAQYDKVRSEIDRLVASKVLKPVSASEWASPIVVVNKPNGKIRVCGDFKVNINSQLEIDRFPIPRIEELFQKLKEGSFFED